MGFVDNLLSIFKMNSDDDYYEDDGMGYDDYQDGDYVNGNVAVAPMMSDAFDFYGEERNVKKRKDIKKNKHKVTPIKLNSSSNYSAQVRVIKPSKMESCQEIADVLLNGTVVLINYSGVDVNLSQRISDFISGAVYSVNGRMERISRSILIAVPAGIGLDGDLHDAINGSLEIPSFRNK